MVAHGSSNGYGNFIGYKTVKRAAPTLSFFGDGGHWQRYNGSAWATFGSTSGSTTLYGIRPSLASSASTENGKGYLLQGDFVSDAEL